MSHSQFHSIKSFILRHAWLNLWDKRMLLAESTRLLSLTSRPHCIQSRVNWILHTRSRVCTRISWRSPSNIYSCALTQDYLLLVQIHFCIVTELPQILIYYFNIRKCEELMTFIAKWIISLVHTQFSRAKSVVLTHGHKTRARKLKFSIFNKTNCYFLTDKKR